MIDVYTFLIQTYRAIFRQVTDKDGNVKYIAEVSVNTIPSELQAVRITVGTTTMGENVRLRLTGCQEVTSTLETTTSKSELTTPHVTSKATSTTMKSTTKSQGNLTRIIETFY